MKLVNVGGIVEVQGAGPEMVDLGLSVKWAKNNIGATCGDTSESWYGGYYAWGETETKSSYSFGTYKFIAEDSLTKYNSDDGLEELQHEDDTATHIYGSNYRMPTYSEIEELKALPNQWVTDYNGVSGLNGRVFTGTNGNTLFIPAAGYFEGSTHYRAGSKCSLWSNLLTSGNYNLVWNLNFDSDSIVFIYSTRYSGFSVRAVQNVSNS